MKKFIYISIAALSVVIFYVNSCEDKTEREAESTESRTNGRLDDEAPVYAAGREAALKAAALDTGSHERIDAMLAIHATANELREAGMDASAEVYMRGAQSVFDSIAEQ